MGEGEEEKKEVVKFGPNLLELLSKLREREAERRARVRSRRRKLTVMTILVALVMFGFLCACLSLIHVHISEMGGDEFFFERSVPMLYWVGVSFVVGATFFLMRFLENRRFRVLFLFSSVLLMICIRMVFPIVFDTLWGYEPDVVIYMDVANSWTRSGVDFGHEGNYHHDYPMSFLIAYAFIKLGVPVEAFFRYAPFFVYAVDLMLLYLLVVELSPEDKRYGAVSAFLLSLSSLGYWITVHYCPNLVGTLFYFLSLYFSVRFAKRGGWNFRFLMPVLLSVFVLILSHHLSTLYFIVTLLGLSFSAWLFKSRYVMGKPISFFVLGTYAYTLWFAYGSFMYPSFFNVYVYFHGFTSPGSLLQQSSLLDRVTFAAYPFFVVVLFVYVFLRLLKVRSLSDFVKLPRKLREVQASGEPVGMLLVYSFGFVFVGVLFLAGFVIPASFPIRVLEVLLVGLYPISSQILIRASCTNPSKKKMVLMFVLVIFIALTGIHRYHRQIQRRILLS